MKLGAALLGLSVVGGPLAAAPAHADTAGWSIVSAYVFPASATTTGAYGPAGDTIVRVTFDVPDDLKVLYFDESGGAAAGGFVMPQNGYAVLDIAQALGEGEPVRPVDVAFSQTQGGDVLWQGTVDTATPARPTELTVDPLPRTAAAGATVRISGTLTRGSTPITGHWVQLGDRRLKECTGAVGYCSVNYQNLGQAQVDSTGHWKADVPLRWTSHLVASYCGQPGSCWSNPNTPAFATAGTVAAKWAPTVKLPSKVRKGRAATYSVNVPASVKGVPVRLQARLNNAWKTVASTRVTTSRTLSLSAKLPVAGRVKVRAYVPGYSYYLPGDSAAWLARKVTSGASPVATVRVAR